MSKRAPNFRIALLVIPFLVNVAQAMHYASTANSLDAMVAGSDLVVRGTVTERRNLETRAGQLPGGWGWVRVSVWVTESMKGPVAAGKVLEFLVQDRLGPAVAYDRVRIGADSLFALEKIGRDAAALGASATVADAPRYVLPNASGGGPIPGRDPEWFIEFSETCPTGVVTLDPFAIVVDWDNATTRILKSPDQICAAVCRIVADRPGDAVPVGKICDDDIGSVDQERLNFLLVPVDARIRQAAERWARSDDPRMRSRAIEFLSLFNDAAAWDAIRNLLDDPFIAVAFYPAGRRYYPVREHAYAILMRERRVVLPKRVLTNPMVAVKPARPAWAIPVSVLVLVALALLGRKLGIARTIAFFVAGIVVCLWLLSWRSVNMMHVRMFGARHELSMAGGTLHYLHRADVPVGPFLSFGSALRSGEVYAEWKHPIWKPAVDFHLGDFHAASGAAGQWGPCRLVVLPAWLFLIPAIGIALRAGFARARAASRRRTRKCVRCGYDLRGTATGCPECGLQREQTYAPSS